MSSTKELGTKATGPLSGVRIIDLTSVVFGAYATQMLGDYGADVIKVEAPSPTGGGGQGGDIMRWAGKLPEGASPDLGPIFLTINRNKRSVLLDLRKKAAVDALMDLIKSADVLASNIRYDGMKRLGLAYEDVKKIKPDIVFVHAAGYGSDGPYAGLPAYDDLIQAGSGVAKINPLATSKGVNLSTIADTICLPFNDFAALESIDEQVAAVILEPIAGNLHT